MWEGKLSAHESRELDELINNDKDTPFREELEKQFYSAIAEKEHTPEVPHRAKIISFWRHSWQVAASVIVFLLLVELFSPWQNKPTAQQHLMAHAITTKAVPDIVYKKNQTSEEQRIKLPDDSYVLLSPGSSIRYKKEFDHDRRDVSLMGKAYFIVQKDPTKPFSVLTGSFATTALGTEFEVNTFDRSKLVVKLFTGKVKVHVPGHGSSFDAVYLTPGQFVSINIGDQSVDMKDRFTDPGIQLAKSKPASAKKTDEMNFENEPLADVFDKLGIAYNVAIEYDREQLSGLYFTGTVLEKDSIKNIITLIANMNGLVALHEEGHFVIRKK